MLNQEALEVSCSSSCIMCHFRCCQWPRLRAHWCCGYWVYPGDSQIRGRPVYMTTTSNTQIMFLSARHLAVPNQTSLPGQVRMHAYEKSLKRVGTADMILFFTFVVGDFQSFSKAASPIRPSQYNQRLTIFPLRLQINHYFAVSLHQWQGKITPTSFTER